MSNCKGHFSRDDTDSGAHNTTTSCKSILNENMLLTFDDTIQNE